MSQTPDPAESSNKAKPPPPGPLSEGNNTFMQPTVLDVISPYLPFKDLKNSRLVCKHWELVFNSAIGKRDLKLVDFSSINNTQLLDLKDAFVNTPSKIKLFKGFNFKWEQIGTMIILDFLTPFEPQAIKIHGWNVMNPSSSLTDLLQSSIKILKDVQIHIVWEPSASTAYFTVHLDQFTDLDFSHTALKKLCIGLMKLGPGQISHNQADEIFNSTELLFGKVCPFLEDLSFDFETSISKPEENGFITTAIKLPVFTNLNILKLKLTCDNGDQYLDILDITDFCTIFPKLEHLETLDSTLHMMAESLQQTKDHNLKTLKIFRDETFQLGQDEDDDLHEYIHYSFPCLEEFICKSSEVGYIVRRGDEILWEKTLKKIEVHGQSEHFNFCHFKKLESIVYTVHRGIDEEEFHIEDITANIQMHLDHLPLLNHYRVSFKNFELTAEQKNQIHEGIPPKFRTIYEI